MGDIRKELSEKDIRALLSLLVDADEPTEAALRKELRRLLHEEPASLERAVLNSDLLVIRRTRALQQKIRWEELEERLQRYSEGPDPLDLEEGVSLLNTFEYPDLERRSMSEPMDLMARDLADPVKRALCALISRTPSAG